MGMFVSAIYIWKRYSWGQIQPSTGAISKLKIIVLSVRAKIQKMYFEITQSDHPALGECDMDSGLAFLSLCLSLFSLEEQEYCSILTLPPTPITRCVLCCCWCLLL